MFVEGRGYRYIAVRAWLRARLCRARSGEGGGWVVLGCLDPATCSFGVNVGQPLCDIIIVRSSKRSTPVVDFSLVTPNSHVRN